MADEVIEADAAGSKELTVSCRPLEIASNIGQLREWVEAQIAPFKGAVLDLSDNGKVAEASKVYAGLNALAERVDTARKERVRELSAPIDRLDSEAKALVADIRSAYREGKGQIDEVREAQRKARRAHLEQEWQGCVGELAGLIGFGVVEDSKWSNATFGELKAEKAVQDKAAEVIDGMAALKAARLEFEREAEYVFYRTASLQEALRRNEQLKAEHKAREEKLALAARLEEERKAKYRPVGEPAPGASPEAVAAVQEASPVPDEAVPADAVPGAGAPGMRLHYTLEIIATREQARRIRDFVKEAGAQGVSFKGVEVRDGE
ncbi:MAG: DUF1351 domain-containing protein [Eggerthellaceae bacterium]|nr:DUF1351 domain-containing protein [Eggerthellaceae bacterium]